MTSNDSPKLTTTDTLSTPADVEKLSTELRDIHLPAPVSAWPPSIAAGMLLGMTLLLVCILCALAWRRKRQNDPILHTLRALNVEYTAWKKSGSAVAYMEGSGVILKKFAIHIKDRKTCARLSGVQWVDWLDEQVTHPVPAEVRTALTEQRYQRNPELDIKQIHTALQHWLKHCVVPPHA